MSKSTVKSGDEVVVIAGTERGKRGKVIAVKRGDQRVIVEGVKMMKKHVRKSQQHPNGQIVEREAAIHVSNVMAVARYEARQAKRAGAAAPKS
jgi:large subunit ribosomal protein L24